MSLTSKLKGIATAGLIGLAGLLSTRDADANVILKIGPVDANNNFVTNVFLNQPFRVGVYLDSTGEPTRGITTVDWDVFFGSLTNYVALNGAQLPNHTTTEDYFNGYQMDSGANRVDGTIHLGYADDNVRDLVYIGWSGLAPSNTAGFLGFYNFTPTALVTNRQASLMSTHVYDTTGAVVPVTVNNVRFTIIPEPKTLGLLGAGLTAVLGGLRRRRDQSGKRGK